LFYILFKGINPFALAGTRTGVWIGTTGSETGQALTRSFQCTEGYSITGCCASMFANRLSFFYDLKGECNICLPNFVIRW